MRAFRSFTVRARLPEALAPLRELAFNLRWSWDERTRDLFRWVDPDIWEHTQHDPVQVLSLVARDRLVALSTDSAFMSFLDEIHSEFCRYMSSDRWFQNRDASPLEKVAYFSPEFGIAEALPQYSGGLGVLAGDHLKAASSLGVPVVGVGLLYAEGYFRQRLNAEGWQEERYPLMDPHTMALSLAEGVRVTVDLAGQPLSAQIWVAAVGRVKLYLLDSNIDDNAEEVRNTTDRLYGGGTEHRLRQEILLGIGGVRALDALGEEVQIFHSNEGHAGFLGLERIRQLVTEKGHEFHEAVEAVRAGMVFTTHTPVPAGIDRFPAELIEKYFSGWANECGVDIGELMALGHAQDDQPGASFNMAIMGLRLAGMSNGVAKLHGKTSRAMFQPVFPGVPDEEVPIGSVTNGVHGHTWASPAMADLFIKYVTPQWEDASPSDWARIRDARDDELWRAREQGKDALVSFVRARIKATLADQGVPPVDSAWADEVLDPTVLTIGFARRFAAYKRATLLFSQPERLKALLTDKRRPVQLIFAGKAHPADEMGKEMIRQIVQFAHDPDVRHRVAFIEDYDIAVARAMLQGCDVWLNNPRRPMEASGTSGQKAALNGGLNCSVLDGWWDEMFDGSNGWQIASAELYPEPRRDEVETNSLFEVLERQVVPVYYDHAGGRFPRQWVARIKDSLASLGPRVQASRMLREYVELMYEPMAARAQALSANHFARARDLAAFKARAREAWPEVSVVSVGTSTIDAVTDLGATRSVTAEVALGRLGPSDVAVELLVGPLSAGDELSSWDVVPMRCTGGPGENSGTTLWEGSFVADQAGRHGLTVRVVPSHPDLAVPAEMGAMVWAKSSNHTAEGSVATAEFA